MIRILLSWILQFILLVGVGSLFTRCGFTRLGIFPKQPGLFQRFWLGLAVVLTLVQLWHLVAPINGFCWAFIAALGFAGLPFLWPQLRLPAQTDRGRLLWGAAFFALLALLTLWNLADVLNRSVPDDTELYHYNVVRWYNEHPVVPGLANLHNRLGFNSAFLVYASLWDNLAWDQRSAWVTHCFFEIVAAAHWLWVIISAGRCPLLARAFALFTLPCVAFPLDRAAPSLYYDLLSQTAILVLVLEILSLRVFASPRERASLKDASDARAEIFDRAPLFLALAAIAFVGKPIGAMTLFTVTCGLLFAAWRWERDLPQERGWFSRWALRFTLPSLLVAGYLARNVFLSGWLLFPAPVLNLHLSWSLPADEQAALYAVIKGFARFPEDCVKGMTMTFWEWFPSWKRGFDRAPEKQLFILGGGLLLAWLFAAGAGRREKSPRRAVVAFLLLLAVANLAFWFSVAPDLRFGFAFCWIFAGLGAALATTTLIRRPAGVLLFCLVSALYFVNAFRFELIPNRGTYLWRWGRAKSNDVKLVTVNNGQSPPLQVWIPKNPEAGPGDSSLPATLAQPPDTLRLRVPGDLRWGFERSPSSVPPAPIQITPPR